MELCKRCFDAWDNLVERMLLFGVMWEIEVTTLVQCIFSCSRYFTFHLLPFISCNINLMAFRKPSHVIVTCQPSVVVVGAGGQSSVFQWQPGGLFSIWMSIEIKGEPASSQVGWTDSFFCWIMELGGNCGWMDSIKGYQWDGSTGASNQLSDGAKDLCGLSISPCLALVASEKLCQESWRRVFPFLF